MKGGFLILMGALLAAGCAKSKTTPGARPLDMSAAAHEAEAREHEAEAAKHAAQYDPGAKRPESRCPDEVICWTSTWNPTAEHLEEAQRHRKIAADHRAASRALREAEARACVGLAAEDRDESPFAHREDIASVSPLGTAISSGMGTATTRLAGAAIDLRAVPGLTREYLQRTVDCHLARNASMGFSMPEMGFCPLSLKGVRASVKSSGTGFRVEIRADDADTAEEVLRRAQALRRERR